VEELLQNLSQKIEVYVAKFYRDPQGSQGTFYSKNSFYAY
jgi:hypothetical protein